MAVLYVCFFFHFQGCLPGQSFFAGGNMDILLKIVQTVNAYLTDYVLIALLVGVGLLFTIRTRFVQVRCFGEGMRAVFGKISLRGGKQRGGKAGYQNDCRSFQHGSSSERLPSDSFSRGAGTRRRFF